MNKIKMAKLIQRVASADTLSRNLAALAVAGYHNAAIASIKSLEGDIPSEQVQEACNLHQRAAQFALRDSSLGSQPSISTRNGSSGIYAAVHSLTVQDLIAPRNCARENPDFEMVIQLDRKTLSDDHIPTMFLTDNYQVEFYVEVKDPAVVLYTLLNRPDSSPSEYIRAINNTEDAIMEATKRSAQSKQQKLYERCQF